MEGLALKLKGILKRYKEIENSLSHQENLDTKKLIEFNKEYSELGPLVDSINEYKKCENNIENLKELLNDKDPSI